MPIILRVKTLQLASHGNVYRCEGYEIPCADDGYLCHFVAHSLLQGTVFYIGS